MSIMECMGIFFLFLIYSLSASGFSAETPFDPVYDKTVQEEIVDHEGQESLGEPPAFHVPQYIRPPQALDIVPLPLATYQHSPNISGDKQLEIVTSFGNGDGANLMSYHKPMGSLMNGLIQGRYTISADKIHIEAVPFEKMKETKPVQIQSLQQDGGVPELSLNRPDIVDLYMHTPQNEIANQRPVSLETLLNEYSEMTDGNTETTENNVLPSLTLSANKLTNNEVPFDALYQSYIALLDKKQKNASIDDNATIHKVTPSTSVTPTEKHVSLTTTPASKQTNSAESTTDIVSSTTATPKATNRAPIATGYVVVDSPSPSFSGAFFQPDFDAYKPQDSLPEINSHILPGFQ